MQKILTIIVPTYNMEKYLDKCLSSLIVGAPDCELMQSLEVLVVNDGSTDSSSEIAHRYEASYPGTFKVVDKENGNYGSCINSALPIATGKYVKVLDADDSFNTLALEVLLQTMVGNDADMFLTNTVTVTEDGKELHAFGYSVDEKNEDLTSLSELSKDVKFAQVIRMHNVAYRTEMIIQMGYRQTEGCFYTDNEWVFLPISMVKSVVALPITVYKYTRGRVGQTVYREQRSVHFVDEKIVALSLARQYSCYEGSEYGTHFLHARLLMHLQMLYLFGCCAFFFPLDEFRSFDKQIQKDLPAIYRELKEEPLHYNIKIKYWITHIYIFYTVHVVVNFFRKLFKKL